MDVRPTRSWSSIPAAISLLLVAALVSCASSAARPDLLVGSSQAIVVTTAGWSETNGLLQRYERTAGGWKAVGDPMAIVTGRTGLAWAGGLLQEAAPAGAPVKREGDGKSPAGIFALGTAFGFDASSPFRLPYKPLRDATECVDDSASIYYNTIVDRDAVPRVDWSSSEKMRTIGQYRWGAVVLHNTPPRPGGGSCIFLHIWGGPSSTTSGCTAMSQEDLETLLRWLDPAANPRLVQLPRGEYQRLRKELP